MATRAKTLLIWGGGGHGKVVAELVRAAGYRVRGFIDADPAKFGVAVEPGGARVVLAEAEFLRGIDENGGLPAGVHGVALAIGDNAARWAKRQLLGAISLPALVHPSAVASDSAVVGAGTVVFPRVVINPAATIGEAVVLNSACVVEHDCIVEDGAHVSPGAILTGGVRVGARSWIGAGAVLLPGVAIGNDAIVGAGAVVVRDVPDRRTVAGVPARPLR